MDGLRLRPIVLADWPAVHSWARLERACRYQAWGPNTAAETQAFTEQAVSSWATGDPQWMVYAVEVDGEVCGLGDLTIRSARHRQGEIGYGVHPDRWGAGLGTRIGAALLHIAFVERGLHRVSATCDPRNVASARILAKLGMTYEGRMRGTMLLRDGWRDSDLFAILATDWPARAG